MERDRVTIAGISFIIYALIRFSITLTKPFDVNLWESITNVEIIILAVVNTILFYWVMRSFHPGTSSYTTMLLLTIGFTLWTFGEILWGVYESILKISPFPSLADFFYIIAYIPVILALYKKSQTIQIAVDRNRITIFLVVISALALTTFILLIYPIIIESEDISLFEKIVYIIYPILDLILIFSAGLLFSKYSGGKLEKSWFMFSIAMICDGIGDILFAYLEWNETYNGYSICNDLFTWSYLLTIFFAMYLKKSMQT